MKTSKFIASLIVASAFLGFAACSSRPDDSPKPPVDENLQQPPVKDTLPTDNTPSPAKEYDSLLSSDAHDFVIKAYNFVPIAEVQMKCKEGDSVMVGRQAIDGDPSYDWGVVWLLYEGKWSRIELGHLTNDHYPQFYHIQIKQNDSTEPRDFGISDHGDHDKYPTSPRRFRQMGRK